MSNSTEWAHVSGSDSVYARTAEMVHEQDPEDRMLDLTYSSWNTALFVEDVAIYADSPEQLLEWLQKATDSVQRIVDEHSRRRKDTVHLVSASGGLEQPSFQSFLDPSDALWRYLELSSDLRPGEYGDRVDLLAIQGSQTQVIASTGAPDEDEE